MLIESNNSNFNRGNYSLPLLDIMHPITEQIHTFSVTCFKSFSKPFSKVSKQIKEKCQQLLLTPARTTLTSWLNKAIDKRGWTPLHHAAVDGENDRVKLLFQAGMNLDLMTEKEKVSAMHLAVLGNHSETVKTLIQLGAKVDPLDRQGNTPLLLATSFFDPEMIKTLIKGGANIHVNDSLGRSALFLCKLWNPQKDCTHYFGQDNSIEDLFTLKLLSHSWSVKGYSTIGGKQKDLEGVEGGFSNYFANKMKTSLNLFANRFPTALTVDELNAVVDPLNKIIDEGSYMDRSRFQNPARMIEDIRQGKFVFIPTGYKGHSIIVIIHDGYLVIANKGGASRKPIEAYKVDTSTLTESVIQEIIDLHNYSEENYAKWLDSIPTTFNSTQNNFTNLLEESYPLEPTQRVGNCAWESLETAVFAAWLMRRLTKEKNLDSSTPIVENVKQSFSHWVESTKLYALEKYLKELSSSSESSNSRLDQNVILTIFNTAWTMPWSEEHEKQLIKLEQYYLNSIKSEKYPWIMFTLVKSTHKIRKTFSRIASFIPTWLR